MRRWIAIAAVFVLAHRAHPAEMRVWEDKKGNQYHAEFIRELFDRVTLRDGSGREIRLAVEELSEHDQKYLRVMVPPQMTVDVVRQTDIKSKEFDDQYDQDRDVTTIFSAEVQIRKVSQRPFTSRLNAELFVIGQELQDRNAYILLSKTDSSFLLGEHNDNLHSFRMPPIELKIYTDWDDQRRGPEYIGYVVAILDVSGRVVQIETKIEWLRDKVPQLRELYARGAASVYSRYFDKETVRKQNVPRMQDTPGRM